MEQIFSNYLNHKRSTTDLLMNILKNMVVEQQAVLREKLGEIMSLNVVEVDERKFRNRCRRVDDCDPSLFYRMPLFVSNNFSYNEQKKVIKYTRLTN